ncbi:MAG: hypothetical protein CMP48_08125 [Rickettsiales bacterium]|nr:hypothetical protein [Rickettsiales bacterium]
MNFEAKAIIISIFSPIFPIMIGLLKIKILRANLQYLLIWTLCIISFASDIYGGYFILDNNYPIFHLYGFVMATMTLLFYLIEFKNKVLWILAILFLLYYIANSLWIEPVNQFNSQALSIFSLIMILISCVSLFIQFKSANVLFIDQSSLFWINVAHLFYFSGALFSFSLGSFIFNSPLPWSFYNISYILKNLILGIAIWRIIRT